MGASAQVQSYYFQIPWLGIMRATVLKQALWLYKVSSLEGVSVMCVCVGVLALTLLKGYLSHHIRRRRHLYEGKPLPKKAPIFSQTPPPHKEV